MHQLCNEGMLTVGTGGIASVNRPDSTHGGIELRETSGMSHNIYFATHKSRLVKIPALQRENRVDVASPM